MYKIFIFVLLVLVGSTVSNARNFKIQSNHIHHAISPLHRASRGLDWCPQCINTFDDLIQIVLDIILQFGILDTCGHLCDLVTEKTGSEILGFACTLGCDFLGIDEFSKFMQNADIDPIYYCETVKLCPVNDNGDANFTSFVIFPPHAQTGSTIAINMVIASRNGTGTGELVIMIQTVDKIPVSGAFLSEAQMPGTFSERITIDTTPDPDCDPTQGPCESWLEGTYNITVMLCNGQCGSHHPHTALYATERGSFTLFEE